MNASGEASIIGARDCPEGLVLEYKLTEYGNFSQVWRRAYQKGTELKWGKSFTYGPVKDREDFEAFMDSDRKEFLRKHWKPDEASAQAKE